MKLKTDDIDSALREILWDKTSADEGYTNIELAKSIYYDYEEMTQIDFARACNRISRRMGAIRKEVYHDLHEQLKEKSRPFDRGSRLKPDFLPFALPIKNARYVWKYFNAARYERIGSVIKNHYIKSEGLDYVARLLESVYDIDVHNGGKNHES